MPEVHSFLCVKHVNWTILDNVNIVTLDSASDGKDPLIKLRFEHKVYCLRFTRALYWSFSLFSQVHSCSTCHEFMEEFQPRTKKIRCLLTLLRAGMTCFNHSTFKPINRWAILVFSALTSDFSSGGVHSYCPLYVNLCYDIASFAISVQLMLKN